MKNIKELSFPALLAALVLLVLVMAAPVHADPDLPASLAAVSSDPELPMGIGIRPVDKGMRDWNYSFEFAGDFMNKPAGTLAFRDGLELYMFYVDADCPDSSCEKRLKYLGPDFAWHDAADYSAAAPLMSAPGDLSSLAGLEVAGTLPGLLNGLDITRHGKIGATCPDVANPYGDGYCGYRINNTSGEEYGYGTPNGPQRDFRTQMLVLCAEPIDNANGVGADGVLTPERAGLGYTAADTAWQTLSMLAYPNTTMGAAAFVPATCNWADTHTGELVTCPSNYDTKECQWQDTSACTCKANFFSESGTCTPGFDPTNIPSKANCFGNDMYNHLCIQYSKSKADADAARGVHSENLHDGLPRYYALCRTYAWGLNMDGTVTDNFGVAMPNLLMGAMGDYVSSDPNDPMYDPEFARTRKSYDPEWQFRKGKGGDPTSFAEDLQNLADARVAAAYPFASQLFGADDATLPSDLAWDWDRGTVSPNSVYSWDTNVLMGGWVYLGCETGTAKHSSSTSPFTATLNYCAMPEPAGGAAGMTDAEVEAWTALYETEKYAGNLGLDFEFPVIELFRDACSARPRMTFTDYNGTSEIEGLRSFGDFRCGVRNEADSNDGDFANYYGSPKTRYALSVNRGAGMVPQILGWAGLLGVDKLNSVETMKIYGFDGDVPTGRYETDPLCAGVAKCSRPDLWVMDVFPFSDSNEYRWDETKTANRGYVRLVQGALNRVFNPSGK